MKSDSVELLAKDELAATRASKAKLCEEIGALKQAKEHQTKQLNKYKVDLQTARESHEAMTKKMKELETLTGTIKQQYIRSLALRIKSSAQALQHLNVLHGTTSNVQIAEVYSESEQRNNNKRKRTSALQEGSKVLITCTFWLARVSYLFVSRSKQESLWMLSLDPEMN